MKKQKLPYTILMGGRDVLRGPYEGKSIPDNFLIDAEGRIVMHKLGFSEGDMREFDRKIGQLLGRS